MGGSGEHSGRNQTESSWLEQFLNGTLAMLGAFVVLGLLVLLARGTGGKTQEEAPVQEVDNALSQLDEEQLEPPRELTLLRANMDTAPRPQYLEAPPSSGGLGLFGGLAASIMGKKGGEAKPSPRGSPVTPRSPRHSVSCERGNTTCRLQACKQLRGKARSLPLAKLGFPLHTNTRVARLIRFGDVFVDATNAGSFRGISGRLLPSSPRALMGGNSFKSCAVVGNSGNLLLAQYGKEIDEHSVVFRVNQAPTRSYARHTGTKTNYRLLNALWSASYAQGRSLPLERGVTLIVSRGAALKRNFELLTRSMKRKRSDVQTTLLQHSALSRTRMVLGAYKRCVQAGGRKYEGGGVPTSGLVLIFNLKDVCGQITVYGFGRERVGGKMPKYQYYSGMGARNVGNPTHCFAAELDLIHALANNNYVRFCNGGTCVGSGTNKAPF